MRIAIHQNPDMFDHSTDWGKEWIRYCQEKGIEYGIVDCFSPNIIGILQDYDALLWHFSNYSLQSMMFARSILYVAKRMGLAVFPDFETSWHFDDKISQMYLLQSVGAPIPKWWVFYSRSSAVRFFESECQFPVVAKLRCGSGSNNVRLIRNRREGVRYVEQMFGKGFSNSPSLLFKAKSNIQSTKNWQTFIQRFRRIPEFLRTRRSAKEFPNERGYVFVQEFIPNDGYDLKVVVVGGKLSFFARHVRQGDFRASGGGSFSYDKSLLTDDIRRTAFLLSDKLGFQSMGYDFIIDRRDGSGKIVEISYGFLHSAASALGGYWDAQGQWYNRPLNVPVEVLENLIARLNKPQIS